MGRISKIKKAEKAILEELSKKSIYTHKDLGKILKANKKSWELRKDIKLQEFLSSIQDMGVRKYRFIRDENDKEEKAIYALGDFDVYEAALAIKKNAYYSHNTACYFNDMTEQIPKTMYISYELSHQDIEDYTISQQSMDASFKKPHRDPLVLRFNKRYVILHAKKYCNHLGVITNEDNTYSYTDIERTLIDSVVNPHLSGGIYNVLQMFEDNKGKYSINKLRSYLIKLGYIYPYHQAVGFLLERAGYDDKKLSLFEKMDMSLKFYLDREITNQAFSKRWNLVYPKDFD